MNTWRLTACEGKQGFATFDLAERVRQRGKRKTESRSVYRCQFCHLFHVGRPFKTRRAKP